MFMDWALVSKLANKVTFSLFVFEECNITINILSSSEFDSFVFFMFMFMIKMVVLSVHIDVLV